LHASATQTSIGMRSLRPAPSPVVLSKNRAIQYGVPHVSLARPFSSKQINEVKQQLQQLDSPVSKSEFLSWNHDHKLSSINNASTLHSTFNYDTAFDQFDETITQTQYRPSTSNTSQTNKRQSLNVNSESNLQTLLSERRSGCLGTVCFTKSTSFHQALFLFILINLFCSRVLMIV
jgi:lipopolysaccharide assembly outer membrane protein LptD (OstA)